MKTETNEIEKLVRILVYRDPAPPRRQLLARQPRLPRVVLQAATSGRAEMPAADRYDPLRFRFGRRLRGRFALPPAQSEWTLSHGDQRCPKSRFTQPPESVPRPNLIP